MTAAVIIPFPQVRREPNAAERHNARLRARRFLWSIPVPVPYLDWELVNYERPVVVKAWLAMVTHLWLQGPIPGEPKRLAAAAGLTPRVWAKHAPTLATFFRRLPDGAWCHAFLSREREGLLAEEEAKALAEMMATTSHQFFDGNDAA